VELRFGHVITVVIYAMAMLLLGWWASRRITGTEGYFVGGRSIPGWAVGLSMLGTAISSVTFLAYPGSAFTGNWSRLIPGLMLPVTTVIAVYFFVVFYRRSLFVSAYEYFERRFGPWARSYTSALWSLGSIYRMGTILYLISVAIKTFTGWDFVTVMLITAIVVTAYTLVGGLEAVIWTDVVQTIVLMLGGLVTILLVFMKVPGGASAVIGEAAAAGKFDLVVSWDFSLVRDTFWVLALSGLFGNIQEFATDQTKIQRYAAAKSDKDGVWATWTVGLGCIPLWSMFMLVGTVLWVFYNHFPGAMSAGMKADAVYPHFIMTQMNPYLGGLVISAVMAAAMSSIDSSMNGAATVLTADFYRRHWVKGKSDMHYLLVARIITAILGFLMVLVSYGLFAMGEDSILDTLFFFGSVMAGGIGGFFLIGFMFNRVNQQGAAVGLATGVLVIIWATLSKSGLITGWWAYGGHEFMINVVGNLAVFVSGYFASLLFKAPIMDRIKGMTWATKDEMSEAVKTSLDE
jgi:solute:Na+ symporter, SSS family